MDTTGLVAGWAARFACFLFVLVPLWADEVGPPNFPAKVTQAKLEAASNENKMFVLTVRGPDPFANQSFEAKIGERTYHFNAGGSASQGLFSASTWAYDDDQAKELIRAFNPVIRKKSHPGHRMLVKFIPAQKKFVAGEPVKVTLRITNVGDAAFAYQEGGQQRGSRDNQFAFSAQSIKDHKMLPDIGDPMHMGGLNGPVIIKPGESHELSVDLGKWFTFQKGDHYRIRGSYEMAFMDPAAAENGDFENFFVLWLDYATAGFAISFDP